MSSARSVNQLREDAIAIWRAGVEAVRGDRLVLDNVQLVDDLLLIAGHEFHLAEIERIMVVGAGKASAAMARGLEQALGARLLREKHVAGVVNVPEDCVAPLEVITLHGARPAGCNEPTPEGVEGTTRMLTLLGNMGPRDLAIGLISGGGSALLPLPKVGVTLEEKLAVTRFLSGAGANIRELNTVRTHFSRVKGGGLARACGAGTLITLILSDVPGDPLELIASGPTVPCRSTAADALAVLAKYDPQRTALPPAIFALLEQTPPATERRRTNCSVMNEVIGNLAVAVDAAGMEAERRGYAHAMLVSREPEGPAEEVGRALARQGLLMRSGSGPDCLITGGEPVVTLPPIGTRGRGGRNQQLVLAAAAAWQEEERGGEGMLLLSGGTDGEDGPTDAAGAWVDADVLRASHVAGLSVADHLARCDAYPFFQQTESLLQTGPTHTNVCDVRVLVVSRTHATEQ